jgi:hypothetical protein
MCGSTAPAYVDATQKATGTSKANRPGHSPAEDSSLVSRLLLAWVWTTTRKGFKKPLTFEDLPLSPRWLDLVRIRREAVFLWKVERERKLPGGPRVFFGLWWPLARTQWLLAMVLGAACGLLATVIKPLLLIQVLRATDPDSTYSYGRSIGLCIGISVVLWLEGWSRGQSMHHGGDRAPLLGIAGTIQLIGEKSFKLKTGEGGEGAETALVGNDLIRATDFLK